MYQNWQISGMSYISGGAKEHFRVFGDKVDNGSNGQAHDTTKNKSESMVFLQIGFPLYHWIYERKQRNWKIESSRCCFYQDWQPMLAHCTFGDEHMYSVHISEGYCGRYDEPSWLPSSTYIYLDFQLFHDKAKRTQLGNLLHWTWNIFVIHNK